MMAEAGCDSVSFGVETANVEILNGLKGHKAGTGSCSSENVQAGGMIAHASFIIGLPGETKSTLLETDQFARSTDALYGYHYLAPFPGTTVREKIQDYDLEIITDDWDLYDANDAIVKTSALLPQDMREFGHSYDDEMEFDWNKIVRRYHEGKPTLKIL